MNSKFYLLISALVFLSQESFSQSAVMQSGKAIEEYDNGWYSSAVKNIISLDPTQYSLFTDGYRVSNPQNGIGFLLGPDALTINGSRKNSSKEWNVRFENFRVDGLTDASLPRTKSLQEGRTISFANEVFKTEYINGRDGLRQNFIVSKKPTGKTLLKVSMDVITDLYLVVSATDKLVFSGSIDEIQPALIYDQLKVWDADNKNLEAHFEVADNGAELSIVVNDEHARYPVTIDPLNHTPEWTSSADGLLSGILSAGEIDAALYGFKVASLGDVNGDGFGDVAITAPALTRVLPGNVKIADAGGVYVFFGSAAGLPTSPSRILYATTPIASALFGFSVAGGDVTGDGINDILVGAPLDTYNVTIANLIGNSTVSVRAGKVYVFSGAALASGSSSAFAEIKLQGDSYFSQGILGLANNLSNTDLFGFDVSATDDLNADGKQDIIVGSPGFVGTALLDVRQGAAFVYYSTNLTTSTPVKLQTPNTSILSISLPITNLPGLLYGFSVDGMGDYNNDGRPDLVVGAPAGVDLSSFGGIFTGQVLGGSAYIYYGNGSGVNPTIGAKLQSNVSGLLGSAANLFGYAVKGIRDVQGQHTGAVMIGAPLGGTIPNALSLTIQTGSVQIFLKKSSSPSGAVGPDQVLESPKSSSLLSVLNTLDLNLLMGTSLDNAYDINCDNIADIIVGEPLSSGTNLPLIQANGVGGAAYVFIGKPDGSYQPAPFYDMSTTYGGEFLSVNATALFGFSVAGAPKILGSSFKPRLLVGSPSGALDFNNSLLNLGTTLGLITSFAVIDNGPGKAFVFNVGSCEATLPVKLIDFNGMLANGRIMLSWTATSEEALNYYQLEKSTNGIDFNTKAMVFAEGSAPENKYQYPDKEVLPLNYYRLKMIENDGSYTYSRIVTIRQQTSTGISLKVQPNPVSNEFTLQLNELPEAMYQVSIRNLQGVTISSSQVNVAGPATQVNMKRSAAMTAGMYLIIITNNKGEIVASTRFVAD